MDKNYRGNASQFFIAGELCRRGYSAVVTLGNTPNTDILCSNLEGTKFVHIQVKSFRPNDNTCSVGIKAEKNYGENFFWILGGIPTPEDKKSDFAYYIIPSPVISEKVKWRHKNWLNNPGKDGKQHNETSLRVVQIPPFKYRRENENWDISEFKNRWDLIEDKLKINGSN